MRWPERFADAALRLIRKLRAGALDPRELHPGRSWGRDAFYGQAAQLRGPDLIIDTPPRYRKALEAGPEELDRQRRRELDLAKILERLYDTYLGALVDARLPDA